ncbi:MAG: hypothetical protein ACFFFG_14170 [Candidatus Thorarchaeota archaeon]
MLLPIAADNRSFFESLFNATALLESMTRATLLNATISNTTALAWFKYQQILDVKYEWSAQTGILIRKEITAPSGRQLVVIPGKGLVMKWGPTLEDLVIPVGLLGAALAVVGATTRLFWWLNKRNKIGRW